MKKYRFEKSVLNEDGYAIIHNESGEKIAECEDAEKAHFLMTAANSFNLDEIELEKEAERLKELIEELYKSHAHKVAAKVYSMDIDEEWDKYKLTNNL